MSFDNDDNKDATHTRNFRGLRMSAVASIEREFREIVPSVLRRSNQTAKVIALFTEKTPRAVENWREGFNTPRVPQFIALAREIPELKAKVLEWLNADNGDGNDPTRLANDLIKFLQERGK